MIHHGLNSDVDSVLLMADIVLYDSSQDIQGFPPLLIRAMTFGIPIIAPDFPVLQKYVSSFKSFSYGTFFFFFFLLGTMGGKRHIWYFVAIVNRNEGFVIFPNSF